MRAVNLLPREAPKRSRERLTAAVQLAIVVAVRRRVAARGRLPARELEGERQEGDAAFAAGRARRAPAADSRSRRPTRSSPSSATSGSPRSAPPFRAASRGTGSCARSPSVLPEDVWLTSLSAQSPQAPSHRLDSGSVAATAPTTTTTTSDRSTPTTDAAPLPPRAASDGAADPHRLHVLAGGRRPVPQPPRRDSRPAGRQAHPERADDRGGTGRGLVHDPGRVRPQATG